jgi:phage terminase small subunit
MTVPRGHARVNLRPPSWLRAAERAEWRRVVCELDRLGFLRWRRGCWMPIDHAAIEGYVLTWCDAQHSQALAATLRARRQYRRAREAARDADVCRRLSYQFAECLGLTPQSRLAIQRAMCRRACSPWEGGMTTLERRCEAADRYDGESELLPRSERVALGQDAGASARSKQGRAGDRAGSTRDTARCRWDTSQSAGRRHR